MISALILAGGESRRMGQPKMLLPWGNGTVLGQVISTYREAGLEDILVVTGGESERIGDIVKQHRARTVFNAQFSSGEMLSSLQCGLRSFSRDKAEVEAVLIGLGDQPQVQAGAVRQICESFRQQAARLVVPSFQMRRGHPWLVERSLWDELLELQPPQSPRDFLNRHAGEILYVEIDNSSILADLDTPQDYRNARPNP